MGFTSVEINNFRGIKHLEIDNLKRINILMGANNVGKSTILEAFLLLAGISNPYLGFKINQYRGFPSNYFNGLETLFHRLDTTGSICLKAKEENDTLRETSISPLYGVLDVLTANAYVSSNNQQLKGLSSQFVIDNKSYTSTAIGSITMHNSLDILSDFPKEYSETIYSKLLKDDTSSKDIIQSLKGIIIEKRIRPVISALAKIEPSLVDITVVNDEVVVDIGLSKYLPLNVLGDGFRKVLTLITYLFECRNGILLIDELDNGLHYSIWNTIWSSLFEIAKDFNVQLVATTHSLELITSLETFLSKDKNSLFRKDIMCQSIKKYPNEEMTAYTYDYENIQIAIEQEIEMR